MEHALRQIARPASRNRLAGAINLVTKSRKGTLVTHDSEYFRRRAAEARAAACSKDEPERVEIAGDLALAYAALARAPRRGCRQPPRNRPAITARRMPA